MSRVLLLSILIIFCSSLRLALATKRQENCLCTAFQSHCWPDRAAWSALNTSIDGQLLAVSPPAAPCHEEQFDERACEIARQRWNFPFWRSDQPGAMQETIWEADGHRRCLISSPRNSSCSQGSLPIYAAAVTTASHVQSAIKFASAHNLRLVIKNTGHDYLGRSTATGSFSIWTHRMKSMTFHENFVGDRCSASNVSIAAVTVGAGVQWDELYAAAYERGRVIVGGSCSSVGAVGGYLQGGGHSALAPAFGLAADNALEFEVVTADGELVIANECQNEQLFWALQGGGGGTFGVVVSATLRTYPDFRSVVFLVYNVTATDRSSMKCLLEKFAKIQPGLSNAGWLGYFTVSSRSLSISYFIPDKDEAAANRTLAPLLGFVESHPDLQGAPILITFQSFQAWHLAFDCGGRNSCVNTTSANPIGVPFAVSSRLIPSDLFRRPESVELLAEAFVSILERYPNVTITGMFVAGGAVAHPRDNAVNPAWRRALWLVMLATSWTDDASLVEQRMIFRRLTDANSVLVALTPGSGTYLNEADYNEPQWQQSNFGEHYSRLYAIKQQIDPRGLFRCHHCVGSENWSDDLNCEAHITCDT